MNDDEKVAEPSPILEKLSRLPFKLVITTNYDRLMERALQGKNCKVVSGFSPEQKKPTSKDFTEVLTDKNGVILYKIHGTFDERKDEATGFVQDKSSIVISEDDYIQFLTAIGEIPNTITSLIKTSTLLFLGYSLEDWDIRTIYEGLVMKLPPPEKRWSFAIQKDPPEFWTEYWEKKGVIIYNIDLYEFSGRLEKEYQDRYPLG